MYNNNIKVNCGTQNAEHWVDENCSGITQNAHTHHTQPHSRTHI